MELSLLRMRSFLPILSSSSSSSRTSTSCITLPRRPGPAASSLQLLTTRNNFRINCTSASALHQQQQQQQLPNSNSSTKDKDYYFPVSGIRVTELHLPNSSLQLHVEVSPRVCLDCYNSALDDISKQLKVHGFRPGQRLPENLILNYVGKKNLQNAAIEAILNKSLPQAMSMVEGRALEDSLRITSKFEDLSDCFSLENVFEYDVVVDVSPTVTWLLESKYKDLKIVVEIDDIIIMDAEKACEMELKRRHKALGTLRIVTERGLQLGDVVVLDICADGETKSSERKGFHLDTEDESSRQLLPGFLDSIIGIRQGQTTSFSLQFPQTWEQDTLRGIAVKYTVKCKELFYRELPPLDDSIAQQLIPGSGCTTLDQVKEVILERCKEVEKTAIDQATDNAILDRLGKIVEIDIPQSVFEEQGRQLYADKLLQLQAERRLDESQVKLLSSEESVREYLEKERENISAITRQMLAVGEIFKCENMQLSSEELVNEVGHALAEFKKHNQHYDEDRIKQQVQDVLEGAKVLEWLRKNSRIEYIKK